MGYRLSIMLMLLSATPLWVGCDFLLGSRQNDTVDEIFEQGAIDPNLNPENVGYVPILPIWQGFSNPVDVFVGYDEMVYVVDDAGLRILDQTGVIQNTVAIPGATDVTQDRRLHTYVVGRVTLTIDNEPRDLAAVYRLTGTASGNIQIVDTIIHPFADQSRAAASFRGDDDEAVAFTGVATLADNTLYVTRKGPRNDLTSIARPDNTVLFFDAAGNNTGYANGLNPVSSSLRSILDPSAIATYVGPPQRLNGISNRRDFVIAQTADRAQYKVLSILRIEDPIAGISYEEDPDKVQLDTSEADRFLYTPNRFKAPADVYLAPDFTNYLFVVDTETDSLYQFTALGYEGVNPPPTSTETKQIIASFGGEGSGPFQFIDPSGVCYFRRTVFVADKGNGRVIRYRLSTDIE